MKLAQRAGMLCNEGAFIIFLEVEDKDAAARRLRRLCEISSRRELDQDAAAAARFREIVGDYELWLLE